MTRYNKELTIALDLIKEAIKITEWFRTKKFQSYKKKDDSPVTLADYASQIYIISKLKDNFPEDQIIAEEDVSPLFDKNVENIIKDCFNSTGINTDAKFRDYLSYRGPNSKRKWTIDPIDGTIGFQKGLSYAIGIGLMVKSDLILSAIGIPNYNQKGSAIFFAEKNEGAKVVYGNNSPLPIKVSKHQDIKTSLMCHSLHYDKPWVMKFAKLCGIQRFIQMDSMAKFCMIAEGNADLYIKPMSINQSFSWDFLPGELLVREAGGIVSDLNGNPLKFENEKCIISAPGCVASNGLFHKEILNIIKENRLVE
ncbi:MAG: inositol monophosphatase family protein [Candidatus Hodarchaeota archaeon]